ncbi:MAG: SgcJ/EcaC family oxidoreductase [Hyphomicrobium sp.]|uniref:SgcJ/EcaC family oxidoreductase n=1 Tax=Hyphomicrobium sp. TaxID=82 RepID=UPI0039E651EF
MLGLLLGLGCVQGRGDGARAEEAASEACAKLSEVQIVQLLNAWRAAFTSGNAEQIAMLYSDDASLIAGKDGKPYTGRTEIRAFYKDFLAKRPRLSIRPAALATECGEATVTGPVVYRMTGERKGTRLLLGGQYQAKFKLTGGKWEIVKHSLAADPRAIGDPFGKAAENSAEPSAVP